MPYYPISQVEASICVVNNTFISHQISSFALKPATNLGITLNALNSVTELLKVQKAVIVIILKYNLLVFSEPNPCTTYIERNNSL